MANLDHLYIETQVSESDIASLKVGNPVTATLKAVDGLELTGQVAAIRPVGRGRIFRFGAIHDSD